ncbi:MAG: RNB domain-containing ribonuclease [Desulfobacteraceae bacterium]
METGSIVEYIDQQKIITAVILQVKNGKLRLLTENNREINFSEKRLSHVSQEKLDCTTNKDFLVKQLKKINRNRQSLSEKIDIAELWEVLHEEDEEIDITTMTHFCFDPPVSSDNEAAVLRAFFKDRLYFKFGKTGFRPYSPEQQEQKKKQEMEEKRRERLIEKGALWIKSVMDNPSYAESFQDSEIIRILKQYYIHEKNSPNASIAKAILKKANFSTPDQVFNILVKAGIWDADENIDLLRLDIETEFGKGVLDAAASISGKSEMFEEDPLREDLTDLNVITIDGQSTLDYDDAISLEKTDTGYRLCIHIIDMGFYVKKGDKIDLEALKRGSSIYMPDNKIPMIPPGLSEDRCSLRQGEPRPAVTTRITMNPFFEITDYDIIPSVINVKQQMSYTDANLLNGRDEPITTLYKMATTLRDKRMKAGAVQITLPEVNIWIDPDGEINISRIDRENPARMLISEFMILANSLMAEFLAANRVPAVFRSQSQPNERLFKGVEESLFLNCMQRKKLSRAVIGPDPEYHAGLGLNAYVTATSPIRKYHDLLTQRQIRGILGYEPPCGRDEIDNTLQMLSVPVANAARAQAARRKYWLLKYLEQMKGKVFESLVLEVHKDFFVVLLKDIMLEWKVPSGGMNFKPGDLAHVTVQHASARKDQLSLFI